MPLVVAVGLVYRKLAPGLGSLRIPVIVYIGVIVVMAWQALARCAVVPGAGPPLAAAGALLFAASDSALALARFQRPFAGVTGGRVWNLLHRAMADRAVAPFPLPG